MDNSDRETWAPMQGSGVCYEVSTLGRVRSVDRVIGGVQVPGVVIQYRESDPSEYRRVNLMVNGKRKKFRVHRAVAEAFIPNPDGKPQVNHINGDKSDNRVENLEWVTPSENIAHSIETGLQRTKINDIQARVIRRLNGYMSFSEIGRLFGISGGFAKSVATGKHTQFNKIASPITFD